jgi:hypothetical protein
MTPTTTVVATGDALETRTPVEAMPPVFEEILTAQPCRPSRRRPV